MDEVFPTQVSAVDMDDSQFVTLKLESGNYLRFQVDTGAQCNVLPLPLYKKATKDIKLANVTPLQSTITAYGGNTLPVADKVLLRVKRGDFRCQVDFKPVDNSNIRPLLGRKACLGMKIMSYLDNDELHKPNMGDSTVYTLSEDIPVSKEVLAKKYPKVFNMGFGKLEGEYHIRLHPKMNPVKHAPRRVPVSLRAPLTNTLEDMVRQDIIAPVTKPTYWTHSAEHIYLKYTHVIFHNNWKAWTTRRHSHSLRITLYRSSMHPQMIQYYKYYAKLFGVAGQNLSQRCQSASVHILISVMN